MKKQFTNRPKLHSFFQLLLTGLFLLFAQQGMATIYYVNASTGDNSNAGTSWASAFETLQKALNVVSSGDEIWVAAGTYKPTTGSNRNASFQMQDGVAIYGGFPESGNPVFTDRDWVANETILSGDIGNLNDDSDNSYHVIENAGNNLDETAILDGFTITKGNANLNGAQDNDGGGMFNFKSSPAVINCYFTNNSASYGAGMNNNEATPHITNCTFHNNNATHLGGGMFNDDASPIITNCSFSDNMAISGGGMTNDNSSAPKITFSSFSSNTTSFHGGGMYNDDSSPIITNCSFSGNLVNNGGATGGGMYNNNASPKMKNCTFIGNVATYGGGVSTYGGNSGVVTEAFNCSFSGNKATIFGGAWFQQTHHTSNLKNCIFWGNSSEIDGLTVLIDHCIVEGGHPLAGFYTILDIDPGFINQPPVGLGTSGNLRLKNCSVAIDRGKNFYNNTNLDLDGNPRIDISFGSETIDMGAYEYQDFDVCTCLYGSGRLYVNDNASGNNNGKSWGNAFKKLQDALDVANHCGNVTEIWVAQGVYKPTNGTDRSISFQLVNNVAIYGGFTNQINNLNDRDWEAYPTILSGDIGIANDHNDNSYHVIFNNTGLDETAILDGFQIMNGNANGSTNKLGGGMYNFNSSPTITNCKFSNNLAANGGGGMANITNSFTKVTNCHFIGNSTSDFGGGMYNLVSSPTLTNCRFSGNEANDDGGGIYNSVASPSILNCSFSGNKADNGGGVFNSSSSSATLTNCILWGNSSEIENLGSTPTVSYSIVQGGYAGISVFDIDPQFLDQPNYMAAPMIDGDLRLQGCSPAIDLGDNTANSSSIDLDNHPRVVEVFQTETIDLGAYEFQAAVDECSCLTDNVIYVNQNALGFNNGRNWANAYTDLQDALAFANTCAANTEIWVAAGIYKPTSGTNRNVSFVMKNDMAIYGGFVGNEMNLTDRNWAINLTTLSGDIGTEGNLSDNSFHVIANDGLDATAILDGFQIISGNASGNTNAKKRGGGIYNISASPSINNCTITGNRSTQHGAGIYNANSSSPTISNCVFSGNLAAQDGGGMFNTASSPTVKSCTFSGNKANSDGGGMYNAAGSAPTLVNCILWGNNSEIKNSNDSNPTVQYSIVKGGYTGTGNLNADPFFTNPTLPNDAPTLAGELHLQMCSAAIDAGDNTANTTTHDLDGNPRIVNAISAGTIDFGAYEYQNLVNICDCIDDIAYVNKNATGNNTGLTWANAFTELQEALNFAGTCNKVKEIWVAAGTYKPTSGNDRNASFEMRNDLAIYGGFAGGEPDLNQRDWVANVTILSGDIGAPSDNSDNSFHVVSNNGLDDTAILDGFHIQHGHADGNTDAKKRGGGIYNKDASPTFYNCFVSNNLANYGAGIYNDNAAPSITDCSFISNEATLEGGGIFNTGLSPELTNCLFSGNVANSTGGGMYNSGSSPALTNCAFIGNLGSSAGGGIYNEFADPTITNCSFSGNSASLNGGGIYNDESSPTLTNCTLWGNSSEIKDFGSSNPLVQYSIVQGGHAGTGNLDLDPLFVSQPVIGLGTAGDLRLQECSPAIDVGDNNANSENKDLDGNNRIKKAINTATIDMGAYEYQSTVNICNCIGSNILYVNQNAAGLKNGRNWTDAFTDLQDALALAKNCNVVTEIWVATGIYKPTSGSGRGISFEMKNNLAIYGGFAGGETSLTQRDWITNETILSGDIGDLNDNSDNSFHVISNTNGLNGTAILNGFTIMDGNASGNNNAKKRGGGMYNSSSSSPSVINSVFKNNRATQHGGGIYNAGSSSPEIINCIFLGNLAVQDGGGIFNGASSPTVHSCSFSGNQANSEGGGMYNTNSSSPQLGNCILWGNSSGIENSNDSNPTVEYSIVQGGFPGTGNLNGDPLFITQPPVGLGADGDLHLQGCSPAIDAGISTGAPITDLDGNPRPVHTTHDMGAYEYQGSITLLIASCQSITKMLDATGQVTVQGSELDDGNSSGCGTLTFLIDGEAEKTFYCNDIGSPVQVILTVTDENSASSTCTATVTVEDNVQPTAHCQTHTVQLDANGNGTLDASDIDMGSTDACGIASLSAAPNSFDCLDVGSLIAVTLTVTDNNGNVNTCTANVTVEDNILPEARCKDETVNMDMFGSFMLDPTIIDDGSSDACGIFDMSVSPQFLSCGDIGINTVTLTVTDNHGNVNTCTATVTVQDVEPPTANCRASHTVLLDALGNGSLTVNNINDGSTDNCGIASLAASPNTFDCSNIGNTNVTLTVTDNYGNTSTCTTSITVEDNVAPTANCQPFTLQLDASGNGSLTASDIDDGSVDACGVADISVGSNSFDCSDIGSHPVTLTVTDNNGNPSTCTTTVTVEDNILPTALCKPHTVEMDASGNGSLTEDDIDNGSSDACGLISISASPNSFDCSSVGTQSVTLTVTDSNGNTNTCTATVTVEDNIEPTALCKPHTVQLDASGNGSLTANDIDGGSSDNCGFSLSASMTTFSCSDIGSNTVALTVTDGNGNQRICPATVTVEDNISPTANCKPYTLQLDANGNGYLTVSDIDDGSGDACGFADITLSSYTFGCSDIGPNTVTLTVMDGDNNESTCTATVTVEDNIPPTALCKPHTVQLDASGNGSLTTNDIDNGSSDACGLSSISASPNSFDCSSVGTQSVTLTVTDNNGHSSTCTASVTVEDNGLPTALCKPHTVQLDASGNGSLTVNDIDDGSNDACGFSLSAAPNTFGCSDVGPNNVTLTVTDNHGNESSCYTTVTVEDNILPTALCKPHTVQLDASGNGSLTTHDIDNGSSDACGLSSISASPNSFDCSNVGTQSVTLTVTDNNGHSNTCTASVTVEDNSPPTAFCKHHTVQLDASGNGSLTANDIDNGSSDACGVSPSASPNSFDCSHIGANTVTLTATDNNGNTSTCTATVTVEDNSLPTALCKPHTVQLDASGNGSLTANDIDFGSNDACGLASFLASPTSFDYSDIGPNTVTLTVTDNSGNESTCYASVTVEDNVPPTALCQPHTVQLDAVGNGSLTANDIDDGSNDTGGVSLMAYPTSFDCSDIGPNTVTLTVTDNNGNSSTCTASVTVEDSSDPFPFCKTTTVFLDANGSYALTENDVFAGGTDNCGNVIFQGVSPNTVTCSEEGLTVSATVTAHDGHGNTATCTAQITVEDNTDPTPNCLASTVYLGANGTYDLTENDVLGGGTDNCGEIYLQSMNPTMVGCADEGQTLAVSVTTVDDHGNTATCTSQVTVEDSTDPQPACLASTVYLDANGTYALTESDVFAGGIDNCGNVIFQGVSPNTVSCSEEGLTVSATVTAHDGHGNTATCTAQVTVEDSTDPTPNCLASTVYLGANGTYDLTENDVLGGGNDNCGNVVFESMNPVQVSCADEGQTVAVNVVVNDGNDNTATCTAQITVEDNAQPALVCKTTTVHLNANGTYNLTENDVFAGGTDNCSAVTFQGMDPAAVGCTDEGQTLSVVVTGIDQNNNPSTCTAYVTVEDGIDPVPVCLHPTVQLGNDGTYDLDENDVFGGGTDNCGSVEFVGAVPGTVDCGDVWSSPVAVTVTTSDGHGNSATCTALVTVEDNTLPVPVCLHPTVQLDASGQYLLSQTEVFGGGGDNCATLNFLSMAPTSVNCSDAGQTVSVTVTVFDASGNQATCTAQVTVEDNEPPVAICPVSIPDVILDAFGNGSLPANIGTGLSTDNCSATEVSPPMDLDCTDVGVKTVILTVTDGFSTVTKNCSFNVVDNTPPVAHCPANIPNVMLNASGNGILPANIGDGSSTDNCSATETSPAMNFGCGDVGVRTVVLTVTDGFSTVTKNCSFNVVDNVAPTANCKTTTINATLNANAEYVVDPNDLNDGSTDACGGLTLSASPSLLDCQHEGANTVTLTVTDTNGNTANCSSIVEVAEFITINQITTTPESCGGMNDGSIVISASANGGQVGYSIDCGATFSFNGSFNNLSPGNYNMVVKVFGVPSICIKTAVADIGAGPEQQIWYKDIDGDGYTDGIQLISCTQPSGYIQNPLPETDCNDYDLLEFPGQVWWEDSDNDNYTNGISTVACQRPSGHKIANELSSADIDCTDTNAAIHPGAIEICNSLDDDCDGEIDEEGGDGLTYVGNLFFSTQADVNAFSSCYSIIDGNLTLSGTNITNLNNLENIIEVTENLTIQYTSLEDMDGLDSLAEVGGTVNIVFNSTLTTLDGLDSLTSVGGSFLMYYNFQLSECCAIYDLTNGGVSGNIVIYFNKVGCNSLADINSNCAPPPPPLVGGPTAGTATGHYCSDCIPPGVLTVFPNPASTSINVRWSVESPSGSVQLTDLLGRELKRQGLEGSNQFDVSQLRPGIYMVRVKADGYKQQVERVVVNR